MSSIRITVHAPDAAVADDVKEQFFKKLYDQSGTKVVFEVPAGADEAADEIIAYAKDLGCKAEKEDFDDPLESADTAVDFW